MAQPHSLRARWRRAYWQHSGEQCLLTTSLPNEYRVGTEIQQNGLRYRITRYDVAPDKRVIEVWGQPIGQVSKVTLQLQEPLR
jgi:hypothetical protein